jgi:hypothetical protein
VPAILAGAQLLVPPQSVTSRDTLSTGALFGYLVAEQALANHNTDTDTANDSNGNYCNSSSRWQRCDSRSDSDAGNNSLSYFLRVTRGHFVKLAKC